MTRIVKKPEERKQEIIEAASELFQSQHYEKTSMKDVMNKVGIAKGTIYHYFRSKEELLESVVEKNVDDYVKMIETLLNETKGNALECIKVLVTSGGIADEKDYILEQLHHPSNMGVHTRQLAITISRLAPIYASVIQQGCDEDIFKTKHPLECAEFILSSIQFLTDIGIYPWTQDDLIRRAMAFPALIETQLQAPKGSFNFLLDQLNNTS